MRFLGRGRPASFAGKGLTTLRLREGRHCGPSMISAAAMTDPAVTEPSPEQTAQLVQRVRRMMIIAALTTDAPPSRS